MTPRHDRNRRARLQRLGPSSTLGAIEISLLEEVVAANAADAMVIITVTQRRFVRFGLRPPLGLTASAGSRPTRAGSGD
jgi:hypothetical protein